MTTKIVVHIGTEKTGTTLLQKWLYENREALSLQGVALTKTGGYPNNRKLATYFQGDLDDYLQKRQIVTSQQREIFFGGFERKLRTEVENRFRKHHTVIFTSEHFHSRYRDIEQIYRLQEFLASFQMEIKIVCYFREQSKLRTSYYSTALKTGKHGSIEEFHKNVGVKSHYYDYLGMFSMWGRVFGMENLVPRIFESRRLEHRDVRRDFIAHACPGIDMDALSYDVESENVSLTERQAIIFRVINEAVPYYNGLFQNSLNTALRREVLNIECLQKGGGIQDPRQDAMYRSFDTRNREFFARFFGRDENLFTPPEGQGASSDSLGMDDFLEILQAILKVRGLVGLVDKEIDALRDVAIRLYGSGNLEKDEAIQMLKVAQKGRPTGGSIGENLSRMVLNDD